MNDKEKNDVLYVCCLIEYVARKTKNTREYIVKQIGVEGIQRNLDVAEVNHCLTFEQICEETIQEYKIENGEYDTIGNCKYKVPQFTAIGKVYMRLIEDLKPKNIAQEIYNVFTSFISEEISNFNSSVFYESRGYIFESYKAGKILDY